MNYSRLKLLIVDHSSCIGENLHALIYKIENISISGHAENLTEATLIFDIVKADIVLIEMLILDHSGIEFLNQIRITKPGVLIIGCYSDQHPYKKEMYPALKLDHTFNKDTDLENMLSTLKNISDAVRRN